MVSDLSQNDEYFMRLAIEAAKIAEENGDVPIGAVMARRKQKVSDTTDYFSPPIS